MPAKIKALLNTLVTYLVIASGALSALSTYIAEQFPGNDTANKVVAVIITAVSVIGTAILIVRRVVTVIPEQRQLEPLPAGTDVVPVNEAPK